MMKIAIRRHFHIEENNFYFLSWQIFISEKRETQNQRKKFSFFAKTIEQWQGKAKRKENPGKIIRKKMKFFFVSKCSKSEEKRTKIKRMMRFLIKKFHKRMKEL